MSSCQVTTATLSGYPHGNSCNTHNFSRLSKFWLFDYSQSPLLQPWNNDKCPSLLTFIMPLSIIRRFSKLTSEEQVYLLMYPEHSFLIKGAVEIASAETERLFGGNNHNDAGDAFRHCYWSAILCRDLGYMAALRYTTAHESFAGNPAQEKAMDLHNNAVGLKIGLAGGPDQIISHRCAAAMRSGQLNVSPQ